jgi:hypothetical protein
MAIELDLRTDADDRVIAKPSCDFNERVAMAG